MDGHFEYTDYVCPACAAELVLCRGDEGIMIYDVSSRGTHTVKMKLQRDDFIGYFTREIKGNAHGRDILDFDFECDGIEDILSDCNLKYDEDDNSFSVILKNNKGVELLLDGMYAEEMNDMIVGAEIINFVSENEVDNE